MSKKDPVQTADLQAFQSLREPVWLWDCHLGKILWANTAGLTFWSEHDLNRLKSRDFDHAMPGILKLTEFADRRLPEEGVVENFLFWTEKGPKNITCQCKTQLLESGNTVLVLQHVPDEDPFSLDAVGSAPLEWPNQSIETAPELDATFSNSLSSPEDQETLAEIAKLLSGPDEEESEEEAPSEDFTSTETFDVPASGTYTNGKLKENGAGRETLAPEQTGPSGVDLEQLAKAGHEIRTPLNSIVGFAELIKEERYGELGHQKYKGYIEDILVSAKHALGLVNDLLEFSRTESGQAPLQPSAIDLNLAVENCISSLQPQTGQARLVIRQSLSKNLPNITADQRSLRQIILNLMSNAIKFTGAGGQIIVSTQRVNDGQVKLRVRDTGIGMSEEDLATAMQPFGQVDNGHAGENGTGLGLPLTKALTEANQADFHISSQEGKGTLVEILFPVTMESTPFQLQS